MLSIPMIEVCVLANWIPLRARSTFYAGQDSWSLELAAHLGATRIYIETEINENQARSLWQRTHTPLFYELFCPECVRWCVIISHYSAPLNATEIIERHNMQLSLSVYMLVKVPLSAFNVKMHLWSAHGSLWSARLLGFKYADFSKVTRVRTPGWRWIGIKVLIIFVTRLGVAPLFLILFFKMRLSLKKSRKWKVIGLM